MMNINKESGSYLKFGGWDPSSIDQNQNLQTFKTPSQKKWALAVNSLKLNGDYLGYFENEINFRPELDSLYLPKEEFFYYDQKLKKAVSESTKPLSVNNDGK